LGAKNKKTPVAGYFDQLGTHQIPIVNGFSQYVVARPADWNEHIHVSGYWFPQDAHWQPPCDLSAFIEAGAPPVFIGFGSMPIKDPLRTTAIVLDALKQTGQRGILHRGWGGLGKQLPCESIFEIEYAPYDWLFPRMALVIHHGGSGTTAFALRSGRPSCAVPFVFDQHYWGERIAGLGVGPQPVRYQNLSVGRLQAVIRAGIGNAPMQQKAAELGEKIRAEDGIENAVRILEGYVIHCRLG
jgi:sterol 3beta-glucosyltransferase